MPTKNYSGSLINHGTTLPDPAGTPDGALFFKSASPAGDPNPAGLYVFGFFDQDLSDFSVPTAQAWSLLVDTDAATDVDADTLNGLTASAFQSSNPILTGVTGLGADTGIVVKTGANTFDTRNISAANTTIAVTNGTGVTNADITIAVNQANLSLNSIGGTLSLAKGGTNATSTVVGGIVYGASTTALATSVVGTSGYILRSNGAAAPTWMDPTTITVTNADFANSAGSATTAGSVTNAVTFNNGGTGAASGTTYNGSVARTISYNTVGAPSTSGANATGTWNIDISGTAADAGQLTTARTISLTGDVTGSVSFNGSANVSMTTTVANDSHTHSIYVPLTGNSTIAGQIGVQRLAVGTVSMPASDGSANFAANITALGFVSAASLSASTGNIVASTGNIVATAGNIVSNEGYFQAGTTTGSNGFVRLQSSNTGLSSGFVEFWSGADNRQGYFNSVSSAANELAATASISYVSGTHIFSGNMTVSGNISSQGNITAFTASDARLKQDISTIAGALDKVRALRGVDYTMIESGRRETGLIAQETLEVVPEVVREGSDGMYGIAYGNLVGLLVEAIKQQQQQIDELKAQVNGLRTAQ